MTEELELERGWVATELRAEFPELALVCAEVEATAQRSPGSLKHRLRIASDRFTGARAVTMRQQAIPWAYRVFFRHIGIDPDETRTPVEQMAVDRLQAGGFRSRNTLDDGLLLAVVETGVPVVAFDADRLDGPLGLRLAQERELLGGDGHRLSSGQLVIADASAPVAVLFGDAAEGRGVTRDTTRMVLAATQVKGVPEVSVEEALWTVADALGVGA